MAVVILTALDNEPVNSQLRNDIDAALTNIPLFPHPLQRLIPTSVICYFAGEVSNHFVLFYLCSLLFYVLFDVFPIQCILFFVNEIWAESQICKYIFLA